MSVNINKATASSSGIGFFGLLGVAFIVLKLCGIITWSWWWILSPLWIPAVITLLVIVLLVVFLWRH